MSIKISRPVAAPIAEQEVTLTAGTVIQAGALSWILPLVLGGVNPAPVEGEKGKPSPIHPAGVKVKASVLDGGAEGSILSISVYAVESTGTTITADATLPPDRLLGTFQVNLDLVLSNANVPRP
jgi:hypothetical protein